VLGSEHARLALALAAGGPETSAAFRRAVAAGAARATAIGPGVSRAPSGEEVPAPTVPRPSLVLLSGGETTVTVSGGGRGGRNTEYLLALALGLDGASGVTALACDTDGIDGTEDAAGALAGADTLAHAAHVGFDAGAALAANDSYGFFAALGDLIVTGPTHTNVNDFRAILIE
jgi:glycerate 2-kinase